MRNGDGVVVLISVGKRTFFVVVMAIGVECVLSVLGVGCVFPYMCNYFNEEVDSSRQVVLI